MLVTIGFRFSTRCIRCSVLGPVPGLRARWTCPGCGAHHDLARDMGEACEGGLGYSFGGYHDVVAEAALLPEGGAGFEGSGSGHTYRMALERAAPACQACGAALAPPGDGVTALRCPCGNEVAVRWPDDETRLYDRRLRCVIGDGHGHAAEAREAGKQGVVIGCARCGGAIAISDKTDRRRLRRCTFCSADNYLPDPAWLALFPEPEHHRCFLVYDLDARAIAALYEWFLGDKRNWLEEEDEARLEAERPAARAAARDAIFAAARAGAATAAELATLSSDAELPDDLAAIVDAALDDDARAALRAAAAPALARRWLTAAAPELRRAAAVHAAIGAAELAALAADPDATVRAAVAARPETPADTLAALRKDGDEKVAAAVRKNPSYRPGFFERLFS